MRRIALLPLLLLTLALGLAACGSDDDSDTTSAAASAPATTATDGGGALSDEPLRVAATPVPHAEILQFVKDNLAARAGLNLEIREFTDYVVPNTALDEGQVDANYFQTPGYLEDQSSARLRLRLRRRRPHRAARPLLEEAQIDRRDLRRGEGRDPQRRRQRGARCGCSTPTGSSDSRTRRARRRRRATSPTTRTTSTSPRSRRRRRRARSMTSTSPSSTATTRSRRDCRRPTTRSCWRERRATRTSTCS